MRWDKKDIPHKGWIEIGMEDLGEEAEFGDEIQYEQCEMCGLIGTMIVGYTKNKKKMIVLLIGKLNQQYYIY